MANFDLYIKEILKSEGGFVNHPSDPGGATNLGITLANWRSYGRDINMDGRIDVEDLKRINEEDAKAFYKSRFWDKIWGDKISSQNLANIIFDHSVNTGVSRGVKIVQELLNRLDNTGLTVDGVMGTNTLNAINRSKNSSRLYNSYKYMRLDYYNYRSSVDVDKIEEENKQFFRDSLRISPNPSQVVFNKGWINRVNGFPSMPIGASVGVVLLIVGFMLYNKFLR